jgi:hypothetical protein
LSRSTTEARKLEIEILETEILDLKGRKREEAMKAYRKLLLSSADEPIYFMRSE